MTKTDDKPAFPARPRERLADGNEISSVNEGLTARQYAAIHLCVPQSGNEWLDDMIREAQRDRFAMAALAGFCAYGDNSGNVHDANRIASAMMQERE
jgi:hypothetical protein